MCVIFSFFSKAQQELNKILHPICESTRQNILENVMFKHISNLKCCDMKPWNILWMKFKVHFVCKSNTGECQTPTADSWGGNINEYMPNLLTMSFCDGFNNSKTESGGLSEGKKSPLIARLYGNTRIMTLLKWINWWYCIDKDWWWTNADFMRHRLELFINSNTFFFLHCTRNPHVKQLMKWCRHV